MSRQSQLVSSHGCLCQTHSTMTPLPHPPPPKYPPPPPRPSCSVLPPPPPPPPYPFSSIPSTHTRGGCQQVTRAPCPQKVAGKSLVIPVSTHNCSAATPAPHPVLLSPDQYTVVQGKVLRLGQDGVCPLFSSSSSPPLSLLLPTTPSPRLNNDVTYPGDVRETEGLLVVGIYPSVIRCGCLQAMVHKPEAIHFVNGYLGMVHRPPKLTW